MRSLFEVLGFAMPSAALLASVVTAQQPAGKGQIATPGEPTLQCYAIWPDTGPWPPYLPGHLILGANHIGGIGFRAAAVLPPRLDANHRDQKDTAYARWQSYGARWSPYGPLLAAESIYVDWFASGVFGGIGELYARVRGDSLFGRAVRESDAIPRVAPWLPIHGRSEPCSP